MKKSTTTFYVPFFNTREVRLLTVINQHEDYYYFEFASIITVGITSAIRAVLPKLKQTCINLFSVKTHDEQGVLTMVYLKWFPFLTVVKSYWERFIQLFNFACQKFNFAKYFYSGLGYKLFLIGTQLFIWVGLTHYSLVPVPSSVMILPKKRRIFLVGISLLEFMNLLGTIRRVRKMDQYKGKGLLEVKSYKGFIRMKSGKKKQY